MKIAAIIVAAGRGLRAGGDTPKQWRPLAGHSSTYFAVQAFVRHPRVSRVVLVMNGADIAAGLWPGGFDADVVAGGETRSLSVRAGLEQVAPDYDQVLIHDAARACIMRDVIDGVIAALQSHKAAAPAVAVVDALWRGTSGHVEQTVDRTGLFRAQTPQGFDLKAILAAHRQFPEGGADDVELARLAGMDVAITPGHEDNIKITLPEDFERAERILRARDGH
ncbi:2-C-methyl-D-erythritol 4-phosphate cytidylyltransferase [Roseobacter fucihabitans]|uniref:2-C-methyl-D-erythritol 4-phosphate cytidylyltransferase n=1 Tax=Roseobacter fucihabitans TaxID=1537242 RepID=A0ABZ2BUJ1_9RHOB|nr:2-C-methyl-D-erythritol 4-phosphate cytidylyltransferase [Roseobacter litoralis]MBC6967744.1 2-C-methyl-D-erythritol 4-phosphate cytidylyltransferase [Roseobacter litoralis]